MPRRGPPLDAAPTSAAPSPLSASSSTASRARRSRRCFAPGSCRLPSLARGDAPLAHRAHRARRPRARAERRPEIHDGLRVRAPPARRGVQRIGARPELASSTAAELGSPSIPNTRASTRLAFPSRIGCRSPRESARIAPAVERPIPGSAVTSSSFRGNVPAMALDDQPGRSDAGSAPARNTRARSTDAAPHRSAPRRGPRRAGNRAMNRS